MSNDHNLADYQTKSDATQFLLNDYNTAGPALDGRLNELEESEAKRPRKRPPCSAPWQ